MLWMNKEQQYLVFSIAALAELVGGFAGPCFDMQLDLGSQQPKLSLR
jgi:hypothetical protein